MACAESEAKENHRKNLETTKLTWGLRPREVMSGPGSHGQLGVKPGPGTNHGFLPPLPVDLPATALSLSPVEGNIAGRLCTLGLFLSGFNVAGNFLPHASGTSGFN